MVPINGGNSCRNVSRRGGGGLTWRKRVFDIVALPEGILPLQNWRQDEWTVCRNDQRASWQRFRESCRMITGWDFPRFD